MLAYHFIIQVAFSYLGTFAFGLFINIPNRILNIASWIGSAGWTLYWIIFKLGYGAMLGNFLAAFLVGCLGIAFSIKKKTPSTMYNAALVPLVPGASGYQALVAFINHNTVLAVTKTVHVAMVAGAIALGYITSQMIAEIIYRRKRTS